MQWSDQMLREVLVSICLELCASTVASIHPDAGSVLQQQMFWWF